MNDMAWMRVFKVVTWRRPVSVVSFHANPSPVPQEFPKDFVEYAVGIGAAEKVSSPTKDEKRALKARVSKEEDPDKSGAES